MKSKQNKQNKIPVPAGLSREALETYYSFLSEEISEIDCGTLCSPLNDGVPLCCSPGFAIPLLYRSELEWLNEKNDLWSPWNPVSSRENKLASGAGPHEIYCRCKGVEHCIREVRSIACRTFPLEPYLDEKGRLAGLVFVSSFPERRHGMRTPQCPLRDRPELIRPEFIDSNLKFWSRFLEMPAEFETYRDSSRELRRKSKKTGEPVPVITP